MLYIEEKCICGQNLKISYFRVLFVVSQTAGIEFDVYHDQCMVGDGTHSSVLEASKKEEERSTRFEDSPGTGRARGGASHES